MRVCARADNETSIIPNLLGGVTDGAAAAADSDAKPEGLAAELGALPRPAAAASPLPAYAQLC